MMTRRMHALVAACRELTLDNVRLDLIAACPACHAVAYLRCRGPYDAPHHARRCDIMRLHPAPYPRRVCLLLDLWLTRIVCTVRLGQLISPAVTDPALLSVYALLFLYPALFEGASMTTAILCGLLVACATLLICRGVHRLMYYGHHALIPTRKDQIRESALTAMWKSYYDELRAARGRRTERQGTWLAGLLELPPGRGSRRGLDTTTHPMPIVLVYPDRAQILDAPTEEIPVICA
jgi:hypothetical protein